MASCCLGDCHFALCQYSALICLHTGSWRGLFGSPALQLCLRVFVNRVLLAKKRHGENIVRMCMVHKVNQKNIVSVCGWMTEY